MIFSRAIETEYVVEYREGSNHANEVEFWYLKHGAILQSAMKDG